jgi:hypothetical protein
MSTISNSNVLQFAEHRSPQDSIPQSPQHVVPIEELLTTNFISRHTHFASLDDLIDAGKSNEVFLAADGIGLGSEWNIFIRSVSQYPDWLALVREAGAEWQIRRIGLIIDA